MLQNLLQLDRHPHGGLMILPETFVRTFVEAITIFFIFFRFLPKILPKGVLVLKGTSDITACQCLALLSTAWQCLALLSTSGLVSGGARGAMAPPKF